jgi:hypothetical protein
VLPNTNTNTKEEEKNSLRSFQKKATRLPHNWTPTQEQREAAIVEGVVDVDRTAAMFLDYWRAAPGSKGTKLDWDATWRNWCRTEVDRRRKANGSATGRAWSTRPTQESALAALEAAAAQARDTYDNGA